MPFNQDKEPAGFKFTRRFPFPFQPPMPDTDKKKRYPLPKRFSLSVSEKAYENLRRLNGEYALSNNYLLTVLLENLWEVTEPAALRQAYEEFIEEYGSPGTPGAPAPPCAPGKGE